MEKEQFKDKTIHLCFSCDPYPMGNDCTTTREIIRLIKTSGNHVQILTKGTGGHDLYLLDNNDWYGITLSCSDKQSESCEPNAILPYLRIDTLIHDKERGIKTWVSFEPVIDADYVLSRIKQYHEWFDKVKIGKLNYYQSNIDWNKFGHEAEELCDKLGLDYYIKDSLRNCMGE